MGKKCINPPTLFDSTQFGFSQIVVSDPGKMVYLSGQVGWDENRQIVGKGDLLAQTEKAIANIKTALGEVGGSLADVVMLRVYVVNYTSAAGEVVEASLRRHFGTNSPPRPLW